MTDWEGEMGERDQRDQEQADCSGVGAITSDLHSA